MEGAFQLVISFRASSMAHACKEVCQDLARLFLEARRLTREIFTLENKRSLWVMMNVANGIPMNQSGDKVT